MRLYFDMENAVETCMGFLVVCIVVLQIEGKVAGKDECIVDDIFVKESETCAPSVFDDLTPNEICGLQTYLYGKSGLDLVKPTASKNNSNYVLFAELHLPNKTAAIAYLDHGAEQPVREAKVVVIRGKEPNKEINELVVGPLPNPTYHRPVPGIRASVPFLYRPPNVNTNPIIWQVHTKLGDLLYHCFGGKLMDCGNKCFSFEYWSSYPPASSGVPERAAWFWLTYDVEYYTLHPLDFSLLVQLEGSNIETVWFQGVQYKSLDHVSNLYRNGKLSCIPQQFPVLNKNLFSTLNKRGEAPKTAHMKRNPEFVHPDGIHYSVIGRHVAYMHWTFEFRFSTSFGPQLYDIRFKNERIVYELGIQEVAAFYAGYSPQQRFSDFTDFSGGLIGRAAQSLVPGVDCPSGSTFYDAMHLIEPSAVPAVTKNVFCMFELNTGEPLRRHHSYSKSEGTFYGGVENIILVLRTILTVVNYDYLIDFRFFQNGVIEVKSTSTGYILANAFSVPEKRYGFQVHDRIVANLHTHLFNFKVDLDVNGQSNRYETINIETETKVNEFSKLKNSTYTQGTIRRHLKLKEKNAAFKFKFEDPKYHIFYNAKKLNRFGNPKAYRLINNGMVKQIIPEGHNKEPAINWARYQHAVTKHKDTEAHSTSIYTMFDTLDQVVDFQKYIDDNENITDEDLVLWVTMGLHHIPHTEDLPLTTTSGMGVSFYLKPFNYFPEDPSMYASNAVRIEKRNSKVHIERHRLSNVTKMVCVPKQTNFYEMIKTKPNIFFEN